MWSLCFVGEFMNIPGGVYYPTTWRHISEDGQFNILSLSVQLETQIPYKKQSVLLGITVLCAHKYVWTHTIM